MLSDLKLAFRQLVKSPGYTVVVVLTLAFGIAVNTNIYGMVSMFFLRPRAVPEPERLMLVLQRSEAWKMPHGISFPDFKDYRAGLRSLQDLFAYIPQPANVSIEGQPPERTWIETLTPNGFAALRVPAHIGRTLATGDGEEKGGAPVAVLSHRFWRQRFGADPAVVGRSILLNGHSFTVIGVAARGFDGFSPMLAMSVFVPTGALDSLHENGAARLEWRGDESWRVMGRLAPGATLEEARAEARLIAQRLMGQYPDSHLGTQSVVLPDNLCRPDPIFADLLPVFAVLFAGLVGLVLFIACANVANLMFARAAIRQHELTVRSALGAGRARLIRQLLAESLVLAIGAGLVGWVLAGWSGALLQRFTPQGDMPVVTDAGARWQDYAFTVAISLLAGLASGLWPALRASRIDLVEQLKQGGAGPGATRHRARNFLVLSQVMFSLVVLVGAGLFLRSLQRVGSVDLGFRADRLLMLSFDLNLQGYPEAKARVFRDELLDRVRALPGVSGAAFSTFLPFTYGLGGHDLWPEDPAPALREHPATVYYASVSPGFHELLGLRLRRGRTLSTTDTEQTPRVAVINTAFADLCWPGRDPLGRRFRLWKDGPWVEVVGVAETAKYVMLSEPPRPFYYVPLTQGATAPLTLVVRSAGDPAALAGPVRAAVHALDAHLPLYDVRTMDDLMRQSIFALLPLRMGAVLAGIQGAIGLLLSVMGLYAVVSFGVAQRTREIGIRMALGADARAVIRFVTHEGVRLTGIGLAIGLVLSAVLGLGLSRFLYGVAAFDPVVLPGVTALLVIVAALACWVPARRATRVNPTEALRAE
ncbi:MAG TPA: ABC transporter permease [Lacunisphaera sp.]|nr:ABC transporter permease [Lacunisphaera sp.]